MAWILFFAGDLRASVTSRVFSYVMKTMGNVKPWKGREMTFVINNDPPSDLARDGGISAFCLKVYVTCAAGESFAHMFAW